MNLSPATWNRLSELLDEALDLAPEARGQWLDRLEALQPTLASPLRKLLAAHEACGTTDPLASLPGLAPTVAPAGQHLDLAEGTRVGPYVLLRIIGGGGMADVWLARRDDGAFNREVALKIPLLSWSRLDLAVRFARERDILARLEHPNIARLYDAGLSAAGLPYLAMEYIDGQPLTTWCDERRLGVVERLRLFGQVLAAVQFAHANLIIHRDLKPSNILVTGDGQVRLLDFGIAKLLAADERSPQTDLTERVGRALTPQYASPEQIRGESLTTASDVYSLGVVLFELLAGVRPYRLKVESAAQLEEAIVSADPLRLSAAVSAAAALAVGVSPRRLARQLSGDLETILLKTLSKAPTERYATVAALGEDLERHLAGRPVHAQPTSAWYNLRKFVVRRRWPVLGTAAAVAAVLAVTAVAVTQARRAEAERRLAEAEARKATAVKDFLIEILTVADPATGTETPPREMTVQQAVDLAATRIGPALAAQPEFKMAVLQALASVYDSLDQGERSVALLQEALSISERHDGVPHPNQAAILVALANVEMFAGRWDASRRWLERAEAALQAVGDTTSRFYANAMKIRGNHERRGATPNFERAIEVLERSAELFRARHPYDEGRLGALFYLAQSLRSVGAPDRAEAVAEEAVELVESTERPGFDRPNAYSLRAVMRDANGNLKGADEDFATAGAAYRRVTGPRHFLTLQNSGLHGVVLLERGQPERGLRLVQESMADLAEIRKGSNTHANATDRLGAAELMVGHLDRAVPVLEEARELWQQRKEELPRTGTTVNLAVAEMARGHYHRAGMLLEEALTIRQKQKPAALFSVAEVRLWLGVLALEQGAASEARRQLEAALLASSGTGRGDLTRQVLGQAALARLAQIEGDGPAALVAADRALAAANASSLQQLPQMRAAALEARGTCLCRDGRAGEGEPLLAESVALSKAGLDATSPLLARRQVADADCLLELGRVGGARALVESAASALGAHAQVAPHFTQPLRVAQAKLQRFP